MDLPSDDCSPHTSLSPLYRRTKHYQTHLMTSHLMLCDCPGLVFPREGVALPMQVSDRAGSPPPSIQIDVVDCSALCAEVIIHSSILKPYPCFIFVILLMFPSSYNPFVPSFLPHKGAVRQLPHRTLPRPLQCGQVGTDGTNFENATVPVTTQYSTICGCMQFWPSNIENKPLFSPQLPCGTSLASPPCLHGA